MKKIVFLIFYFLPFQVLTQPESILDLVKDSTQQFTFFMDIDTVIIAEDGYLEIPVTIENLEFDTKLFYKSIPDDEDDDENKIIKIDVRKSPLTFMILAEMDDSIKPSFLISFTQKLSNLKKRFSKVNKKRALSAIPLSTIQIDSGQNNFIVRANVKRLFKKYEKRGFGVTSIRLVYTMYMSDPNLAFYDVINSFKKNRIVRKVDMNQISNANIKNGVFISNTLPIMY